MCLLDLCKNVWKLSKQRQTKQKYVLDNKHLNHVDTLSSGSSHISSIMKWLEIKSRTGTEGEKRVPPIDARTI